MAYSPTPRRQSAAGTRRAITLCYRSAMDINIETLIEEVERRPALYDTELVDYRDRNRKKTLWEEICLALDPRWSSYSETEQTAYGKEVQKKWNSLRDCFRRELCSQVNPPSDNGTKKKAKYRYFDALLFLVPFTQVKNNESPPDNVTEKRKDSHETPIKKRKINQDILSALKKKYKLKKERNIKAVQEKKISTFNDDGDEDDDKLFLLSLLPSFKNCTMEEKFSLRVELMKTIMTFKKSHSKSTENSVEDPLAYLELTSNRGQQDPESNTIVCGLPHRRT